MDARSRWTIRLLLCMALLLLVAACGTDGEGAAPGDDPDDGNGTDDTDDGNGADDTDDGNGADDREEVTLTLITGQPENAMEHEGLWLYLDRLEEVAPWINVDYRGGPEVIEQTEQFEAVGAGSYDMTDTTPGYYLHVMPAAHGFLLYDPTEMPPHEQRQNGAHEEKQTFFDEVGIHHLGVTSTGIQFMVHLGDRGAEVDPENPDLTGFVIRGGKQYEAAVRSLGGEMTAMPVSEVFTAMERGVIDGFGFGNMGLYALGVAEVSKYEIHPPFNDSPYGLMINQDRWNSLDEETRQAMTDVMAEMEPVIAEHYAGKAEEEYAQRVADGGQVIEFTGDVREAWLDAARNAGWEEALELEPRLSTLQELLTGGE